MRVRDFRMLNEKELRAYLDREAGQWQDIAEQTQRDPRDPVIPGIQGTLSDSTWTVMRYEAEGNVFYDGAVIITAIGAVYHLTPELAREAYEKGSKILGTEKAP